MNDLIKKRDFLAASVGLGVGLGLSGGALAQGAGTAPAPTYERGRGAGGGGGRGRKVPNRMAKTTKLFKAPPGFPNAMAINTDAPGGVWIAEQKMSGAQAVDYGVPEPKDLHEAAWLVDWNGKLIKTVMTPSRNTSGMGYGEGCVWMGANEAPEGIFQVDVNSGKVVSHRQIPLGFGNNGGGCHGVTYVNGKLWLTALRLGGLLRVDAKTWEPEALIPTHVPNMPRTHCTAWDNGSIWVVTGTDSTSWAESQPGLARYDGTTGALMETVSFAPKSADPHGLVIHEGKFYSCDAGIHPGWKTYDSPTSGWVFRIDFI